MAMQDLAGKNVVITGAAAGIGRATALAFAASGAHIFVSDIDLERLAPVVTAVRALGMHCHPFAADVSSETSMRQFAEDVHALVPAADILVNNAGVAWLGAFMDSPLSSWKRIMDINLMGVVHGCHFFLPNMRRTGRPCHVLNVASLSGIVPQPNMSAYTASKHAVMGLSDTLTLELDNTPIVISVVCPGVIDTDITHSPHAPAISIAQMDKLQAYYKRHGVGPEVVAAAMVAAVRNGRGLVLTGPFAKPMYHVKRVSRALLRILTLSDARKNGFL